MTLRIPEASATGFYHLRWKPEGKEADGGEEGSDSAALFADLLQSLCCKDSIPIQAFSLRGFGLEGVGRTEGEGGKEGNRWTDGKLEEKSIKVKNGG